MHNNMKSTFDKIHAETELKNKTVNYLHETIGKSQGAKKVPRFRHKYAAILASIMLFAIAGSLAFNTYFSPTAFIDIDVNPAVELSLNRFGRVIEATPFNEDGANLLDDVSVQHLTYEKAVEKLMNSMKSKGYFENESLLSMTVQSNDNSRQDSILNNLKATVDHSVSSKHINTSTSIFTVSEEVRIRAHENHVTPAKYLAITELKEVDATADFENFREHSIKEINQKVEDYKSKHNNGSHSEATDKSEHSDSNHE